MNKEEEKNYFKLKNHLIDININFENNKKVTETKNTSLIINLKNKYKYESDLLKIIHFKESKIINKNKSYINLINSWIEPKNKNKKWKLLFNSEKDGFSSEKFHQKVANIPKILTIVKSKHGNNIFGGYTTQYFLLDTSRFIDDEHCFLFNLQNKKRFNIIRNFYWSIYDNMKWFPNFGYITGLGEITSDLCISDNCNEKENYARNGSKDKG
jgi:hypothetical protein